jgi:colanic acid biosynthesis glycosyl transferase WcaI
MGAMMAMADLHLLPQLAEAADLVLPSKLINMLASGRPVIATCAPGTGLFAEVEGCGMNTPPGDAAALARAIAELADDPLRRHQLGAAAVRRAEERWHKDTIIDRALAFVRTRMA